MSGRLRERRRERAAGDEGFTIVEAVVSMVLLMVLSTVVLAAVVSNLRVADQVRSRTTATGLATREVAEARALLDAGSISVSELASATATTNPTPLDGGTVGEDLTVAGTDFTVQRTIELATGSQGQALCGTGGTGSTTLNGSDSLVVRIAVSVTWSNRMSYAPVEVVELVPLPESLSLANGGVLVVVQVVDPTSGGAGVEGAKVELSVKRSNGNGFTLQAGTTDANGCVVARMTSVDGYTYTAVATKSGYVSQSWTTSASSTLGSLSYRAAVSWTTISYAQAGAVQVRLTNAEGTAAATDAEAAGLSLTLLCSSSGTAASGGGWTTTLTAATLDVRVWPCLYSAYVGDEVPASMTQVQVEPPVSENDVTTIWVRPGYGIVSGLTAPVVPDPDESGSAEESDDPDAEPDGATDPETGTDAGTGEDAEPGEDGGTGTDASPGTGTDPGSEGADDPSGGTGGTAEAGG
ncbi:MAG TPA: hypothetical protein VGC67_14510 [Cellulomonas sp.]